MTKKLIIFGVVLILLVIAVFAFLILGNKLPEIEEKIFPERIYKIKYSEEVRKASEEFNVPEELIYAVIKTESDFTPDATSPAGAKGLMQLMPETYSWVAMKLGEKEDPDKICDVATNIRYGTYCLSFLMERLDNDESVYAAYNAGYTRIKGWLADSRYSSDGKTLSNIPYEETDNYVKKVSTARVYYKKFLSEEKSE